MWARGCSINPNAAPSTVRGSLEEARSGVALRGASNAAGRIAATDNEYRFAIRHDVSSNRRLKD